MVIERTNGADYSLVLKSGIVEKFYANDYMIREGFVWFFANDQVLVAAFPLKDVKMILVNED